MQKKGLNTVVDFQEYLAEAGADKIHLMDAMQFLDQKACGTQTVTQDMAGSQNALFDHKETNKSHKILLLT